jgi:hypothetical protein
MQDNQATARSLEYRIEDGKTKYLAIHLHYVREWVACVDLVGKWLDSGHMLADLFTKPLGAARPRGMSGKLGLRENDRTVLLKKGICRSGVQ